MGQPNRPLPQPGQGQGQPGMQYNMMAGAVPPPPPNNVSLNPLGLCVNADYPVPPASTGVMSLGLRFLVDWTLGALLAVCVSDDSGVYAYDINDLMHIACFGC
jgi:hypothetical protein